MKKLMKTLKQITILCLAITFLGCEEDDAVLPQVKAGFTYTLNIDTGTVTFINTSTEATKYTWDFGDDTSSSLINPVKVYPNGTYTVALTASNVAGASDTFEDEILILIPEVATLPITFDGENTKYEPTPFNGSSFEVIDNPDLNGTNTEATKVGAITNSGAEYEGISFELGTPIDLSTDKTIKMDVWSNTALNILLKLEDTESEFTENSVSHEGTGWEELYFTLSDTRAYPKLVLFVDGPGTTSGTFYIDNIEQIPTDQIPVVCVLEDMQSLNAADFNVTFMADPTDSIDSFGAGFTWIDNPDADNDVNPSCKVGKIDRQGSDLFANNQIDLDAKLDFTTNSGFKMKVWSPNAGTNVLVKLEDKANNAIFVEKNAVTTVANAWEELTFPFASSETNKHDKIILFFELNTSTTEIYYIDDFALYSDGSGTTCTETSLALPIDFDCATINYVAKDTGDVAFEVVDNPELSGINATPSKVGKMVFDSNQPWENMNLSLDTPIDFSTDKDIKLKLFSTTARVVKLKVETGGTPVENDQNHTGTGWEELTFTMPTTESFSNLILFVDGGLNTTGTFYIDDIEQVSSSGGTGVCPAPPAGELLANGGFEANSGDGACWQFILDNGTAAVSNEFANTGTYSAKMTTGKEQSPKIKMERFAPSITGGVTVEVTFKYRLTTALGTGSILQVLAFSELTSGAVEHNLGNALGDPLDTWNTYTQTFTTDAAIAEGISLLIQLTGSGNDGAAGVVYIDDVQVTQM